MALNSARNPAGAGEVGPKAWAKPIVVALSPAFAAEYGMIVGPGRTRTAAADVVIGSTVADVVSGSITQAHAIVVPSGDRKPASGIGAPKRRAASAILSLALILEERLPGFSGEATTAPTLYDRHRVQRIVDAARKSSDGAGWVPL